MVRNGLVNDLLVRKYREDADLRRELRVDEDDLDELAVEFLVKLGVDPQSVDTAAYPGQVNTPREMVDFISWCYNNGTEKL